MSCSSSSCWKPAPSQPDGGAAGGGDPLAVGWRQQVGALGPLRVAFPVRAEGGAAASRARCVRAGSLTLAKRFLTVRGDAPSSRSCPWSPGATEKSWAPSSRPPFPCASRGEPVAAGPAPARSGDAPRRSAAPGLLRGLRRCVRGAQHRASAAGGPFASSCSARASSEPLMPRT